MFVTYSHSNVTKYNLNYWYYSVLKLIFFVLAGEMAGYKKYNYLVKSVDILVFINSWLW